MRYTKLPHLRIVANPRTSPPIRCVSSEIQNAEASAAGPSHARHNDDDEEIASVKRVPAVTLHLWESILKPRGFELQQGRLIRSPSKSQSRPDISYRREPSPSARALRRGSLKEGDGDPLTPASAIQSFRRARSFAPVAKDASTPLSRQPFRRAPTVGGEAMAGSGRTASLSFLGRSVGSVLAAGGISADMPIASTSTVAGPSRAGSVMPENADGVDVDGDVSEGARELFKGMRIRALGEARSANVRRAVEECGGTWVSAHDDDDDTVDFIVVRLVRCVLSGQCLDITHISPVQRECAVPERRGRRYSREVPDGVLARAMYLRGAHLCA